MKLLRRYWNYCTDFSGRTTAGRYWGIFFICVLLAIPVSILEGVVVLLLFKSTELPLILMKVMCALWFLGLPAMTVRRLRDAGYSPRCLLWLLIPIVGAIAVVARLCQKTKM